MYNLQKIKNEVKLKVSKNNYLNNFKKNLEKQKVVKNLRYNTA